MQHCATCWIRLAEIPLWIQPRHSQLLSFLADYQIQPTPADRAVYQALTGDGRPLSITEEDMAQEAAAGELFPPAYLESLALYRKICHLLLKEGVLLFHCSALEIHGKAILFTAKSGTGKSTHARLWRQRFGPAVTMINDDKPLLKVKPTQVTVYGTPYAGKEGLHTNTSAPVAAIVILHQARENYLHRVSTHQAYPILLQQSYRSPDALGLTETMDLVGLLSALPVYQLGCTISTQAVELVYGRLKGDGYL